MAIAFDNAVFTTTAAGPNWTFSYTVGSSSNRVLLVHVNNNQTSTDVFTGVTYNGVAMTRLVGAVAFNTADYSALYYLVNPATGANNVVVSGTWTAGWDIHAMCASYSGVVQTNPTNAVIGHGSAPFTQSVTLASANNWAVSFGQEDAVAISASTNITNTRAGQTPTQYAAIGDSGLVASSGSYSQTWSAASNLVSQVQVGLEPIVAATATYSPLLMMGIG